MKLKLKPSPPPSTEVQVKDTFPSTVHAFKPGAEWKGNAGGRPRLIGQTLEQRLLEEVVDLDNPSQKVRRLDLVVRNLIQNAMLLEPHAVSAFREIRATVEPPDQLPSDRDNFSVAREVLILMIERGKTMEVRDI